MAVPLRLRVVAYVDRALPVWAKRAVRRALPRAADHVYRSLARSAPDVPQQVKIQNGPLRNRGIVCSLRREQSYYLGSHEPAIAAAYRTLSPGDCVLDVGGHIGYTALLAAQCVGPSGRVIVFEPSAANRSRIKANLTINPDLASAVTIVPLAVSSEVGMAYLDGEESTAHLTREGGTAVETTTLDTYVREHDLRPALIKMDIEGAEEYALPATAETLHTHNPQLLCEVHSPDAWQVWQSVLQEAGYSSERWTAEGWHGTAAWCGREVYRARPLAGPVTLT